MRNKTRRKLIQVLSCKETRQWYSPFSKILRDTHQSLILQRYRKAAASHQYTEYAVYDAYEGLIATGRVGD